MKTFTDTERLNFLCDFECQLLWNQEDDYCNVYLLDNIDGNLKRVPVTLGWYDDERSAIDAAMKKLGYIC